jgi:hypothetical protein
MVCGMFPQLIKKIPYVLEITDNIYVDSCLKYMLVICSTFHRTLLKRADADILYNCTPTVPTYIIYIVLTETSAHLTIV